MRKTFIFCSQFKEASASNGILSVISLARSLEKLGCDVYFFYTVTELPEPETLLTLDLENLVHKEYWQNYRGAISAIAAQLGIKLLVDRNDPRIADAFVVYNERIISNPLNAPNVIRYFGNKDGALNGGRRVNANQRDFILAHSRIIHPAPHFVLFFSHVNPLFNDIDAASYEGRKKSLTYIGKGDLFHEANVIKGTELLTRTEPSTKEGLAELLKKTRFLFTWDTMTNLVSEAIHCGAIPVLLTQTPVPEEEIDAIELGPIPRVALDKIHFSDSPGQIELSDMEELNRFETSRNHFVNRVAQYNSDYPKQVESFLESVVRHFADLPVSQDQAEPPNLLESTQAAFALASRGELPITELFTTAQSLANHEQFAIAIQLHDLWLNNSPASFYYTAYACFNKGKLQTQAKDDASAEISFRAAINCKSNFIEAKQALAALLKRTNRSDEASAVLRD